MSLLNTADELLNALANHGGVIVSSSKLTDIGIAQARACGRMYVNDDGLGFIVLHNCHAQPNSFTEIGCGEAD